MEVTLRAQPRSTTGKGSARQARMAGRVPAILYGRGIVPTPLAVDSRQIGHALHTEAGANVLVNLEVEGGRRYLTMVREVQRHPARGPSSAQGKAKSPARVSRPVPHLPQRS